ncbi:hypothetical protein TPHA_0G01400 [Tetrapisispora phaffii CBS 4417]|uniref:Pre-mRNA-splicing factor CEF1 n=1 Tax=Tetrapisispora phaffii (strain ATCC 24235 / CBS 4417 / NBRC 1672 / NRRL Y-8282 / UCD 70-5) TaxID=1071381 RepID=G8BVP9_TETPH|nr:hypothetical protein TPHA_0G01400 [Tetrapisispora phaffii CBS 4417]CCE63977.1 hypothetical protein TPHA_0G01400 [Tetrapisispora phaffii CBS 4417]
MAPVPIYVKGGIWTNIEDQILKAAIQKYGTHQWSKISSLLQKKSAKQCELRWNEFLNPTLNLSAFTKEEDTKLLDLARKIPNQWRTIADLMGRPAQLCMDRYNDLLSNHLSREEVSKNGGTEDDLLQFQKSMDFKLGEMNPVAESLVAKPDNGELETDEKEMLEEAKARLMNTQGKKATRKIRERMLEQSKHIAELQRRRELKQSKIDTKLKKGRKRYATEIDYNEDIIYEQTPIEGLYDTTEEDLRLNKKLKTFERKVDKHGLQKTDDEKLLELQLRARKEQIKAKKTEKPKQAIGKDEALLTKLTGTDSILTNDYKKPKLILSKPGESEKDYDILLTRKTAGIVANKSMTPILDIPLFDETEEIKHHKNTEDFKSLDPELEKKALVLNIRRLFKNLPEPENNFEILLDDAEEEEENEERDNSNPESLPTEIKEARKTTLENLQDQVNSTFDGEIELELKCLHNKNLVTPSFIETPADEFDHKMNELIALKTNHLHYKTSEHSLDDLSKIEELMSAIKMPPSIKIEDNTQNIGNATSTDKMVLEQTILNTADRIKTLREDLKYIVPLETDNHEINKALVENSIPDLRALQHRYYVNYKMYQKESKELRSRKTFINQHIIESTSK